MCFAEPGPPNSVSCTSLIGYRWSYLSKSGQSASACFMCCDEQSPSRYRSIGRRLCRFTNEPDSFVWSISRECPLRGSSAAQFEAMTPRMESRLVEQLIRTGAIWQHFMPTVSVRNGPGSGRTARAVAVRAHSRSSIRRPLLHERRHAFFLVGVATAHERCGARTMPR